jgi:hypothetical protein
MLDGRFLLSLCAIVLFFSGGFAIFQSITGYFLPQDVQALGFDAQQLAATANHRVVKFMFHDRVAFGGTLLAVGFAYWFLAEFPLRGGFLAGVWRARPVTIDWRDAWRPGQRKIRLSYEHKNA